MNTPDAIAHARAIKDRVPAASRTTDQVALVTLLDHGDKVEVPDFETTVRMVAANVHAMGRAYIEIAVDPKTKEVGWSFEPTTPGNERN